MCADGESRPLWRCDYLFLQELQESKRDQHLRFQVFAQEGQGQIRRSTFMERLLARRLRIAS
jgi:hypothetical protein